MSSMALSSPTQPDESLTPDEIAGSLHQQAVVTRMEGGGHSRLTSAPLPTQKKPTSQYTGREEFNLKTKWILMGWDGMDG